jgi:quercetin dioxygenase-like cupin family protein
MPTEKQKSTDNLFARAMSLAGSIDYQQDAVVSKTLIAKKTGTLTLFAFDGGQGLSEHSAPYDALVYIFDGEAEITIGGKENIVKNGEMIILPANIPHALKALIPYKMLLIMIKSQE